MKSLIRSFSSLLVVLLAACATPPENLGVSASNPMSTQIMQACVKAETPAALQKIGPKFKNREEAGEFVDFICQLQTRICQEQPGSDDCQKGLRRYGLGDPGYKPSASSALMEAAFAGATPVVKQLLAEGTNPNVNNVGGWTPLMMAAAERHLDTVITLLEAGADPNARNNLGRSALMFAASYGQDAIVERLLAAGANPNNVPDDPTGWTALVAAAAKGNTSTVALLLRGGADPKIKTKQGESALDISRQAGHAEVTQLLQEAAGR